MYYMAEDAVSTSEKCKSTTETTCSPAFGIPRDITAVESFLDQTVRRWWSVDGSHNRASQATYAGLLPSATTYKQTDFLAQSLDASTPHSPIRVILCEFVWGVVILQARARVQLRHAPPHSIQAIKAWILQPTRGSQLVANMKPSTHLLGLCCILLASKFHHSACLCSSVSQTCTATIALLLRKHQCRKRHANRNALFQLDFMAKSGPRKVLKVLNEPLGSALLLTVAAVVPVQVLGSPKPAPAVATSTPSLASCHGACMTSPPHTSTAGHLCLPACG